MKYFFLFLFLSISIGTSAQQNFNQHNPYVSNSEIHWLRQQEINLFNQPIADDAFTSNIRKTIDNRNAYRSINAKYIAVASGSTFFYVLGTAGFLFDNYVFNDHNINLVHLANIVMGIGGTVWAVKIKSKRKEVRTKYDQQLQITRDQYNMLKGD